jgi:hypothetical protein
MPQCGVDPTKQIDLTFGVGKDGPEGSRRRTDVACAWLPGGAAQVAAEYQVAGM